MEFWLIVFLLSLPSFMEGFNDPLGGWFQFESVRDLRELECERITLRGALAYAPEEVRAPQPRGDFMERDAVVCRRRLIPLTRRHPRDEAMLTDLRRAAPDLAGLIDELPERLRGRTWVVEVFHPDSRVAYKISFAVKNAMVDRGLRVSDRAPTLTAGDVEVIGEARPQAAYPLACARYSQDGALTSRHALLGVVLRDRRETALHVGVCADGEWRWLR